MLLNESALMMALYCHQFGTGVKTEKVMADCAGELVSRPWYWVCIHWQLKT